MVSYVVAILCVNECNSWQVIKPRQQIAVSNWSLLYWVIRDVKGHKKHGSLVSTEVVKCARRVPPLCVRLPAISHALLLTYNNNECYNNMLTSYRSILMLICVIKFLNK